MPARYRPFLLILLLLSPSIVFGIDYLANSGYFGGTKQVSLVSSGDGYNATMLIGYPSYIASGQQVPVTLNLKVNFSSAYTSVGINDMRVEVRNPAHINGTTNVVTEWQTLAFATATIEKNYTSPTTASKTFEVTATNPPSSNPIDLFLPVTKMAVNGVSDITLYSSDGNNVNANPISLSYLDNGTVYQTQLQIMRSVTALVVYQLVAALLVSLLYLRTRVSVTNPVERRYSMDLESFRLNRSLAKLEDFRKLGKIAQNAYEELKQKYENELAQLKER